MRTPDYLMDRAFLAQSDRSFVKAVAIGGVADAVCRVICSTSGTREFLSSFASQKYFCVPEVQLGVWVVHPASLARGVSRSSRHARRVVVDADVPTDERRERGRRSRVVLARPCRRQVGDDAQRIMAGDGDKRWFPGESPK